MGYHRKQINKGVFGEASKIFEEVQEFEDALDQNAKIMELCELSDLIGAIEAYSKNKYGISLDDLILMKNLTKSAFEDGRRTSS